jgi:hypothetical protein
MPLHYGHQRAGPIVHPPGDMVMENRGGMLSTGENGFVYHSYLAILTA